VPPHNTSPQQHSHKDRTNKGSQILLSQQLPENTLVHNENANRLPIINTKNRIIHTELKGQPQPQHHTCSPLQPTQYNEKIRLSDRCQDALHNRGYRGDYSPSLSPESSNKGGGKMPPLARATPEPLKQMRQQQAAEAELLAAHNRQREGIRREQEKIRAAEAAEKKANQDRLANNKTPKNTSSKDQLLDPTQNPDKDPEILPDTTRTEKVTTPEGDVAEASMDSTLSEEVEGDNISGNKELRDEAQHEDENISKRLKQPLTAQDTE
jgi:hypothetical protein